MGGLRSSGTHALGLRGRHKYTLRQGPLDRRESGGGRVGGSCLRERECVAGLMCCRMEDNGSRTERHLGGGGEK